MSFLSKILAKRKDRRPRKRSAAHIPRGIATDQDHNDYWNGPSLGPDVIPAIPRSPIDYAFNKERQVWQPQPRPVSPILPIQADKRPQDRYPLRHQASTGDLGRVKHFMSSPTASSFASASSPQLVNPDQVPWQQRSNGSTPDDWPLSPVTIKAPFPQDASRTPSPLSTQDSFDDVGTLPIERPSRSSVSPLEGSSSASSQLSLVEDMLARFHQHQEVLRSQEELVLDPSRVQQQHMQPHPHLEQSLPDQVEYVSDGEGSEYEDENDEHEAQGLGHFSTRSAPIPTQAKVPASPRFFLGKDDKCDISDEDSQAGPFEYDKLAVRMGDQYISDFDEDEPHGATDDDDTVSELSSYSAAAAAFPLASQSIGIATSIDPINTTMPDPIITTFANLSPSTTNDNTNSSFANLTPSTERSTLHRYGGRDYFPVITPTALSPPPQHSARLGTFRFSDDSGYDRASSNVIDFAPGAAEQFLAHDADRGRTSWVSSVSSYYGDPAEEGDHDGSRIVGNSYGVPYSGR